MIKTKPSALFTLTALAVISTNARPAEERMRAGLWESTMTSEGTAVTHTTHCYTAAETELSNGSEKAIRAAVEAAAKKQKSACTLKELTVTATTVATLLDCGTSTQLIKTTYRVDSFEAVITTTPGPKMVITAKRIGTCP
jgi:hypothetical protein